MYPIVQAAEARCAAAAAAAASAAEAQQRLQAQADAAKQVECQTRECLQPVWRDGVCLSVCRHQCWSKRVRCVCCLCLQLQLELTALQHVCAGGSGGDAHCGCAGGWPRRQNPAHGVIARLCNGCARHHAATNARSGPPHGKRAWMKRDAKALTPGCLEKMHADDMSAT